jgi:5-methylcytosine-specific restriction protein A
MAKRIYESTRWRKLRRLKLKSDPLCALCPPDCRRPATEVDHIASVRERPDLTWTWGNLQSLCHECHCRKTAAEKNGVAVVMPGCDVTGMPTDPRHWWRTGEVEATPIAMFVPKQEK